MAVDLPPEIEDEDEDWAAPALPARKDEVVVTDADIEAKTLAYARRLLAVSSCNNHGRDHTDECLMRQIKHARKNLACKFRYYSSNTEKAAWLDSQYRNVAIG
jgi:hypothetical protein